MTSEERKILVERLNMVFEEDSIELTNPKEDYRKEGSTSKKDRMSTNSRSSSSGRRPARDTGSRRDSGFSKMPNARKFSPEEISRWSKFHYVAETPNDIS